MTERTVSKVRSAPQMREGGGFLVRRSVGSAAVPSVGCFLMLDHLGPAKYGPGEAVGAPDHPHRGFETVTYVLSGGMHHQDSHGNAGTLAPGWVQWMTAGSGVIHSEMPSKELLENGGVMEGFQLWVNLPAKDKMIPPRYQDTPPERIPKVTSSDGKTKVAVVAGESLGVKANIETRTPILYLDIQTQPGAADLLQDVPAGWEGFAYCYRGQVAVGPEHTTLNIGEWVVLGAGAQLRISGAPNQPGGLLLIAGEPINEPIVRHGPFVMNTQQQIRQAFEDYHSGHFGEIAGKQERFRLTDEAVSKQKETGRW